MTGARQLVGLGLVLATVCGCSADLPTQIVLAMATDLRVPDDLDRVKVWVERDGKRVLEQGFKLDGVGARTLPGTMALTAGSQPEATVLVTVRGERSGKLVVQRQARLSFVSGAILLLRMDLLGRCVGVSCASGQSCTDKGCQPTYVDAATLPEYSEAGAFPPRICSNGKLDPGEQCDGTQQGGKTCKTLGYSGGGLACSGSCKLDTTSCHKLLDPGGIKISGAAHKQWLPQVAAGPDGRALVVWEDYRKDGPGDAYGTLISASGKVLQPAGLDLSRSGAYQTDPVVAANGSGYLVAWGDNRNGFAYDIYGTLVDPAGKVLNPAGIPITTANPKNGKYHMSVASDGKDFLVVWSEYLHGEGRFAVKGRRVSSAGKALGGADFRISNLSSAYTSPRLAYHKVNGNFLVVYNSCDKGESGHTKPQDIFGALVSKAGEVLASPGQVSICAAGLAQSWPAVAAGGEDFMVVWLDGRSGKDHDIYGARVDRGGKLLDPQAKLVSKGQSTTLAPAVAYDGAGKYLVVRSQVNANQIHLFGTRLDLSGKVLGSSSLAISQYDSWKERQAVTRLGSQLLVVWTDFRNGSSNGDIYGARLVP